jgi:hypothetical protein
MCTSSAATWFAACGQIAVGVAVAYIAWRQHKVAQEKLRLDLFEKRYAVYRAFVDKIRAPEVSTGPDDHTLKIHDAFWERLLEAKFLFGDDLNKYLKEVWKRSLAMSGGGRGQNFDEQMWMQHQNWFYEQFDNPEVDSMFRKYLGFDVRLASGRPSPKNHLTRRPFKT